jgi:valine--pyruvate aminotransferase
MSEFSLFGQRFSQEAGILELMDDLGKAFEGEGVLSMLGGGNPASIPEMNQLWRRRLTEILAQDGEVEAVVAQYDAPGGRIGFKKAMAEFLSRNFGWNVGPRNIAITAGSQSGFFLLFNLLSGEFSGQRQKKVLFPLAPEYIGYADQALCPGQLTSHRPLVVEEKAPFFKYHVNFSDLDFSQEIGALCAGRPTNPTGNVLTDDEVKHLAGLARQAGVPFLLDNAYGAPFPSILFEPVAPYWDENTVLSMSLSKLGLPSVRTGILVAPEPIARAVASANSILNLTNPGLGQALVQPMLENNAILDLSLHLIRPFYQKKLAFALDLVAGVFANRFPYRIHRPQGSIFLWFWFPGLKIGSRELYRRLKERRVVVVPGDAFFFGLPQEDNSWPHRRECIRVNYARDASEIETGMELIADVVEEAGQA